MAEVVPRLLGGREDVELTRFCLSRGDLQLPGRDRRRAPGLPTQTERSLRRLRQRRYGAAPPRVGLIPGTNVLLQNFTKVQFAVVTFGDLQVGSYWPSLAVLGGFESISMWTKVDLIKVGIKPD